MKTTTALLTTLLLAAPALATQTQNAITGQMAASDSNCPSPVPVFNQDDCSYNASNPTNSFIAEWIGPLFNAGYYAPGTSPGPNETPGADDPVPGDGKTPPPISGSVTIDDQGTADGADDTIDATIVIGQTVRNFGAGARGTAEETWTSLTMRLASLPVPPPPTLPAVGPIRVSSATPNASGGFDYVIGSLGMPPRLVDQATGTDVWPSETGPDSDSAVGLGHYWSGPSPIGIAPIEPNASIGSSAIFTTSGYVCDDPLDDIGGAASACDAKGRLGDGSYPAPPAPQAGGPFENILLQLSTDASRNIIDAEMIWVQQQDVIFPVGPDSWVAGVINFSGVQRDCGVAGVASDDSFTIGHDSSDNILAVGANDTLLAAPATATICAPPDHGGTATVVNSPDGNPLSITVNYAPPPGYTGIETFQYTVADGTVTARGIVTVEVAFLRAIDDQANVIEGDAVDIDVTANDSAGSGPIGSHTVTITRQPNVGTATVGAGNMINYVSVAGSHGNDNFEYTLTDVDGDVSETATVQVGIGLDREPTPAGGVSALGPWSLLLLCGALLRRGGRRAYVNTGIAE